MKLGTLASAVFWSVTLLGQSKEPCLLDTAKNGDVVRFRGEAFPGGHDTFIRPNGCITSPANRVILIWADDQSLAVAKTTVRRNSAFSEFNRLLRATFPLPSNTVGAGQSRYRVLADFEGRLEVSPSAGLKRDPKTKKVVRVEGFGSPMPYTRFRLLATGVSKIKSEEQKPAAQHEAKQPRAPAKR